MIAARQIWLGRGGGAKLPYDAEVEWIGQQDNNDSQYILTKVVPPPGSILRCRFRFGVIRDCFSAIGGIDNTRFGFGIVSSTFYVTTDSVYSMNMTADTNWHEWLIDEVNGVAKIDDNPPVSIGTHAAFTGSGWSDYGFPLFRRLRDSTGLFNYGTRGSQCSNLYIGTSNGTLFDGIPVRFTNEQSQREGAMYDRVSGQLFRNQGTGAFLYGNDK